MQNLRLPVRSFSIPLLQVNFYLTARSFLGNIDKADNPPALKALEDIPRDDWQKVLFAMAPEKVTEMMKFVSTKNYEGVCFVKSADIFFEMIKEGITKGSALKKYRELDNFKGYTFVAAGDYNNDIEMLIEADLGAAPANAQPEVKAAADIVLKSTCDEGAIAELIDVIIHKCKIG